MVNASGKPKSNISVASCARGSPLKKFWMSVTAPWSGELLRLHFSTVNCVLYHKDSESLCGNPPATCGGNLEERCNRMLWVTAFILMRYRAGRIVMGRPSLI